MESEIRHLMEWGLMTRGEAVRIIALTMVFGEYNVPIDGGWIVVRRKGLRGVELETAREG